MTRMYVAMMLVIGNLAVLSAQSPAPASSIGPDAQGLLTRHYQEGDKLHYRMTCTNRDRVKTLRYEIQADGVVKKSDGRFFEEFAWSGLVVNGSAMALSPGSQNFRQVLSLEPNPSASMPDLTKVDPILIGPITDMLTFYADVLLAKQGGSLASVDDHFYFKHGAPVSWADGTYVTLGQSSIDFDFKLTAVDRTNQVASLTVEHVPPEKQQITIPSEWMRTPVADTPNNWVSVSKTEDGKYSAAVGKETFNVQIKISLLDGRIISVTMDNPVEIKERICSDKALSNCGEPVRYQILRQVAIN